MLSKHDLVAKPILRTIIYSFICAEIKLIAIFTIQFTVKEMNMKDISQGSKKIMNQVTDAVEKTGKKVASQVSNITDGKAEEITEDAIQAAVDQALDILQVAGEKVRKKNINGERVTLEVGVGVVNVAHLKIITDVAGRNGVEEVNTELS